jgi:hypothetical protein
MCWRVPTEAARGLTIGVLWAHSQLPGTQILAPIQPSNEFTMTEDPKLEWVTPKISVLESEDTQTGKVPAAAEQFPNQPLAPSFNGPS